MAEGITPLEFMLRVMREEPAFGLMENPQAYQRACEMRFEAAKAAAPYIHPRLAAIEHTGRDGGDIEHSLTVTFVDAPEPDAAE